MMLVIIIQQNKQNRTFKTTKVDSPNKWIRKLSKSAKTVREETVEIVTREQ